MILQKSIYTILFIPFIHFVDILKAILSIHTRGGKRSLNYAQKLRIWFSTWGERHWRFTSFQKARIPEKSISFIPGTDTFTVWTLYPTNSAHSEKLKLQHQGLWFSGNFLLINLRFWGINSNQEDIYIQINGKWDFPTRIVSCTIF